PGVDFNSSDFKSSPIDPTGNASITVRDELIELSEKHIKPRFGEDFFGRQLVKRLRELEDCLCLVPDSRFPEEIKPVVDAFPGECMIIRITRKGHDFTSDSG